MKNKWGIQLVFKSVACFAMVFAVAQGAEAQSLNYTTCASEGGQCSFLGTMSVRYGAGTKWVTKTATNTIACTNAEFGDPAPGVQKSCQLTFQTCANEGGTCAFTGSRVVRYGANTSWNSKILTGGTACTNTVFGDPAFGVAKTCQVSVVTSGSVTTSTTMAPPVTTTTLAPATTTTTLRPSTGIRDKFKQPFAVNSIWNMPIGSNAQYVPANLKAVPGDTNTWMQMPYSDDDVIVMRPTAPLVPIKYSSAGWNAGANRCTVDASARVLANVPIPSTYTVPHNNGNMAAAFLMPDGRTIVQTQPLARCRAGDYGTSLVRALDVDLFGDGIQGAHGGSGMSAIGGALRVGELRPGQQGPKHAIKLVIYMKEAFRCTTAANCYRWPARHADGYAVGHYGTGNNNPNVNNAAMVMGALLAIPANVNLANLSLETEPARQLAWTLQNYGGYVVDDSWAPQFGIPTEIGPDGSFPEQFRQDYGFSFNDNLLNNSPWRRDIQKLLKALSIVNNNSPTTIGGGGTPRQPLAPPMQ